MAVFRCVVEAPEDDFAFSTADFHTRKQASSRHFSTTVNNCVDNWKTLGNTAVFADIGNA